MFVALVLLASRVKLEHLTDPLNAADAAPPAPAESAVEPSSPGATASAVRSAVDPTPDTGFRLEIIRASLHAHIEGKSRVLLQAVEPDGEQSQADLLRAHDLTIPTDPAASIRAAFVVEQSRNYFAVCVRWAKSEGFSFAAVYAGWSPEIAVSSGGSYLTVMHETAYLENHEPDPPSSFATNALTWYPTLREAIAHVRGW
jgi:hypothetical protein